MSDQALPAVEMDALEAISAMLDGPEGEPEDEQEEVVEASEEEPEVEAEAEAEEETEEESQPEQEPLEVIQWNGEDKQVTKSELKELAQKGFDYTQKTQQLAEAKKAFEAQAEAVKQSIALQNQNIEVIAELKSLEGQLNQFKEVNWLQLAEQDPVQYLKLNQTYRDLKDAHQEKIQQFHWNAQQAQQKQQQQVTAKLQTEAKALADAIPEFKGEKRSEAQAKLKGYLSESGFSAEEIGSLVDHRQAQLAWKAMQYDALQKSKPQIAKKVAEKPPVVKAGTNKPQPKQADRDAYDSLKKTGRGEYAAKLIEKMI